jgi:hypothetical protein
MRARPSHRRRTYTCRRTRHRRCTRRSDTRMRRRHRTQASTRDTRMRDRRLQYRSAQIHRVSRVASSSPRRPAHLRQCRRATRSRRMRRRARRQLQLVYQLQHQWGMRLRVARSMPHTGRLTRIRTSPTPASRAPPRRRSPSIHPRPPARMHRRLVRRTSSSGGSDHARHPRVASQPMHRAPSSSICFTGARYSRRPLLAIHPR